MTGLVHVVALVDELLTDLGATIADPGPGKPRTVTTPNGETPRIPAPLRMSYLRATPGTRPDLTVPERFAATARQPTAQPKPKEHHMTDTDPYAPATCPLPHCAHDLHLVTNQSRPVHLDDLERGDTDASDPYTATWRVECEDGHVVLLPNPEGMRCTCGDDACNGDRGDGHADFDGSDDYRTFRVADVRRLRDLVDQFAATVAA